LHRNLLQALRQRRVGAADRVGLLCQALDFREDFAEGLVRLGIAAMRIAQFGVQPREPFAQ
jgi:hypothetical protein